MTAICDVSKVNTSIWIDSLKKIICPLLIIALVLAGCANTSQFNSQRAEQMKKAEAELKKIDESCQEKHGITSNDLVDIINFKKRLSKNQYNYRLCFLGAKYNAFQSYFIEKAAWKKNLQSNALVTRSLYQGRISKKTAYYLEGKNNQEFEKEEQKAISKLLLELQAKDKQGQQAVAAGIILAVLVVALAAAAGGGGYGGNSYTTSDQGNCQCPYDLDAIGNRCGGRSAWSRSGGATPQCY